jgi:hypothetical protein
LLNVGADPEFVHVGVYVTHGAIRNCWASGDDVDGS